MGQKMTQLRLKKIPALFMAGVFGGKVQGQGAQGIDQPEVAHVPAKVGFHADDAHHQFGGHAETLLSALQCLAVLLPKRQASSDAARFDKALSVGLPIFSAGRGRWQDQRRQAVQSQSMGNVAAHPWCRQLVCLRYALGQGLHLGGVAMAVCLGCLGVVRFFDALIGHGVPKV